MARLQTYGCPSRCPRILLCGATFHARTEGQRGRVHRAGRSRGKGSRAGGRSRGRGGRSCTTGDLLEPPGRTSTRLFTNKLRDLGTRAHNLVYRRSCFNPPRFTTHGNYAPVDTVRCDTARHSTAQCSTRRRNTTPQHNTTLSNDTSPCK